ncbi:MAG: hypothetical protein MAG581_00618 [Deltaproteobacteria bacterium]|nr:hypothetical protein [Deltaproteobacteria bacterium]
MFILKKKVKKKMNVDNFFSFVSKTSSLKAAVHLMIK